MSERSPLQVPTASRPFWFAGRREPQLAPGGFAGIGGGRVQPDRPDPRLVAAARGTVVRVIVTPPQADGTQVGLGTIVDPAGHVLTSDQVVRGATAILVELPSGRTLPVVRIRRDLLLDLAVLAIDAPGLPSLPLGESNGLRVGESLTAVGLAADATVANLTSTGSATGSNLTLDAPLPARTFGGPLLGSDGHLVGIATGVTPRAPGVGQAIPIDRAKHVLREFRLGGSPGGRANASVSSPETSSR